MDGCCIVYIATFNNISVISWGSVLLMEETGVPGENHRPVASHWQTVSHNVVSSIPYLIWIRLKILVVIGTDCIGSYKSNYHTFTTMTALCICILLLNIITLKIIVLILDTLFIHFVWRFSENYILWNRQNGKRGLHKELEKRQRRK